MDPQDTLQLNPQMLARVAPSLPTEALRVAVLFDGHRRTWEVLRDSPLPARMTMPVVERLVAAGVVAAPAPRAPSMIPQRKPAKVPGPFAPTLRIPRSAPLPQRPADAEPAPDALAPPTPRPAEATAPRGTRDPEPEGAPDAAEATAPRGTRDPEPEGAPDARNAGETSQRPAEPWTDTMVLPRVVAPADPPPSAAFDETDEAFFESYQPEDESVDTFWDLEDTPLARRRAQERQQRMQRQHLLGRGHSSGGWLRSILGMV